MDSSRTMSHDVTDDDEDVDDDGVYVGWSSNTLKKESDGQDPGRVYDSDDDSSTGQEGGEESEQDIGEPTKLTAASASSSVLQTLSSLAGTNETTQPNSTTINQDDDMRSVDMEEIIVSDDEDDEEESNSDEERLGGNPMHYPHKATGNLFAGSHPQTRHEREIAAMIVGDKPWRPSDEESKLEIPKIPVPGTARSVAMIGTTEDEKANLTTDDEFSMDDEDEISLRSSELSATDLQEDVEWHTLPPLPNSFIGNGSFHTSMAPFLDEIFQPPKQISKQDSNRFVVEHSLLLRAILELLEERDQSHPQENSPILKQGALKKLSHSVGRPIWKVKYVQVRRGTFSFYEDDTSSHKKSNRATIVRLEDCICRPADAKAGGNFLFELAPKNNPKRLSWMCSSEEERQSWLRIIREAKQERKRPIDLGPYQFSVDTYRDLQCNLRWSQSKDEYMLQFGNMSKLQLEIPIQWVLNLEAGQNKLKPHDRHKTVKFWKFLANQTVIINGHAVPAGSVHGPERIIGALTRCILEYDRSFQEGDHSEISELQAVSYAREILLAVWQSQARDDSHFTIDSLCQNPTLVIVLPLTDDNAIHLNLIHAPFGESVDADQEEDTAMQLCGWVTTRSKSSKNWKNRFCVVSEGVLSYFEHASPRPHGLKGQVVLVGATLTTVEQTAREDSHLYILQIQPRDSERERQLAFREEAVYEHWRDAIQHAIDSVTTRDSEGNVVYDSPSRRKKGLRYPTRTLKKGVEGGGRMVKGAAQGSFQAIKGAVMFGIVRSGGKNSVNASALDSSHHSISYTGSAMLELPEEDVQRYEPPSVQIEVESRRSYRIMTADPVGNEETDTWVTVQAKTSHKFKASGGPQGRLSKNEENLNLYFQQGLVRHFEVEDWGEQSEVSIVFTD